MVCMPMLVACFPGMCGNQVQRSVASPSGKMTAVAFFRDCGATTGFSTQVSLLPNGRALPNEPGNTYVVNGKVELALEWIGDSTLRIHGAGVRTFKQETLVSGIAVTYADRPR